MFGSSNKKTDIGKSRGKSGGYMEREIPCKISRDTIKCRSDFAKNVKGDMHVK